MNQETTKPTHTVLLTKKEVIELLGVVRGSDALFEFIPAVKVGQRFYYQRAHVLTAPDKLLKKQQQGYIKQTA